MFRFAKSTLVASLMTAALVSADNVRSKFATKGYSASASASYADGCPFIFPKGFSVYTYATQTHFTNIDPGNGFTLGCNKVDEFYLTFTTSSCDETTVTYQTGTIYDSSYLRGVNEKTKFSIESVHLLQSSLEDLQVPVFQNTCDYECTEICYPELYEYGTCPEDELPYLECFTTECELEETFLGNAVVSVNWEAPKGTKTPLTRSSSVMTTQSEHYSSMNRLKGSFRYDVPVTISATLDGVDLFPSQPEYVYAELAHTTSMERSKSSGTELYSRRMQLLNN